MKEDRQTSFAHLFDAEEAENQPQTETVADLIMIVDHEDDFPIYREYVHEEIANLIGEDLIERGYDQTSDLYTQRNHLVVLFSEGEQEEIDDFLASDLERLELNLTPEGIVEVLVNGFPEEDMPGISTNPDLVYIVIGLPEDNVQLPVERAGHRNLAKIASGLVANALAQRVESKEINLIVAGADGYRIFRAGLG